MFLSDGVSYVVTGHNYCLGESNIANFKTPFLVTLSILRSKFTEKGLRNKNENSETNAKLPLFLFTLDNFKTYCVLLNQS